MGAFRPQGKFLCKQFKPEGRLLLLKPLPRLNPLKLLATKLICMFPSKIQEGNEPDNSLYERSILARDELFCKGSVPVNLLFPRNKVFTEPENSESGIAPDRLLKLKSS
jgi:hypothetical protein